MVEYKINDIVWARMKGFPPWPGIISDPPKEIKAPSMASKKKMFCIKFFGTNDYAWLLEETVKPYAIYRERFCKATKPHLLKTSISKSEDYFKKLPEYHHSNLIKSIPDLPSIDEEISIIFSYPLLNSTPLDSEHRLSSSKRRKSSSNNINVSTTTRNNQKNKSSESKADKKNQRQQQPQKTKLNTAHSSRRPKKEVKKRLGGVAGLESTDAKKVNSRELNSLSPSSCDSNNLFDQYDFRDEPDASNENSFNELKSYFIKSTPIANNIDGGDNASIIHENNTENDGLSHGSAVLTNNNGPSSLQKSHSEHLQEIHSRSLRLGFIGVGYHVVPTIVHTLLNSGHQVGIWDKVTTKCNNLMKLGAVSSVSASELFTSSDIVFFSLPDSRIFKKMIFSDSTFFESLKANNKTCLGIVNLTSLSLELSLKISDIFSSLQIPMINASIIVSSNDTKPMTLVSGNKELFDQTSSILKLFSSPVFMGEDFSKACKTALLVKSLQGCIVSSLAEVMSLAEKIGIPPVEFHSILTNSNLSSGLIKAKGKDMVEGLFPATVPLEEQQRDMKMTVDVSNLYNCSVPQISASHELYKRARELNCGKNDVAAIHKIFYL